MWNDIRFSFTKPIESDKFNRLWSFQHSQWPMTCADARSHRLGNGNVFSEAWRRFWWCCTDGSEQVVSSRLISSYWLLEWYILFRSGTALHRETSRRNGCQKAEIKEVKERTNEMHTTGCKQDVVWTGKRSSKQWIRMSSQSSRTNEEAAENRQVIETEPTTPQDHHDEIWSLRDINRRSTTYHSLSWWLVIAIYCASELLLSLYFNN